MEIWFEEFLSFHVTSQLNFFNLIISKQQPARNEEGNLSGAQN